MLSVNSLSYQGMWLCDVKVVLMPVMFSISALSLMSLMSVMFMLPLLPVMSMYFLTMISVMLVTLACIRSHFLHLYAVLRIRIRSDPYHLGRSRLEPSIAVMDLDPTCHCENLDF